MAILTEDMKRVVREQILEFVASVCPDGSPNLSPKGTTSVWDNDHLIFVDLASPTTMANLAVNPVVEVNVVDPVLRKGYRLKGRASVHTEGPLYDLGVRFFERERSLEASRIRGVAIIAVEYAAALISPAYAGGTSEQKVMERSALRLEEIYGWKIEQRERPKASG